MHIFGRNPIPARHPVALRPRAPARLRSIGPGHMNVQKPAEASTSDDSRWSYLVLQDVKRSLAPAMRMQYMQVAGQLGTQGKMVLSWTVMPDGRASNVTVGENSIGSRELQQRVVGLVSRWRYPEVKNAVTVSFPFVFG